MRNLIIGLLGIFALSTNSCFAKSISLDDARSKGFVCEDANGFVRSTGGGADVEDMTVNVNKKRLGAYKDAAKQQGVSVESVQKSAAQKLQSSYKAC